MSDSTPKRPGRLRVLDAFLAADDRTLTNAQLGNLRGVQAWHQRMSNLKAMGYVFTDAVRLKGGYYAYRLLGYVIDSDADAELTAMAKAGDLPALAPALAAIRPSNVGTAIADGTRALRGTPPPVRERPVVHPPKALTDEVRALRERVAELEAENERLRTEQRPRATRKPAAERGPTGPALMRKALEAHGKPMHSKAIAAFVLANGGDALYKGKTPDATMAAQLATSNKTGGEFVKTTPGCFGLREWDADKLALEPIR